MDLVSAPSPTRAKTASQDKSFSAIKVIHYLIVAFSPEDSFGISGVPQV